MPPSEHLIKQNFLDKYPRTQQVMNETGMDIDQLYIWSEIELRKLGNEAEK